MFNYVLIILHLMETPVCPIHHQSSSASFRLMLGIIPPVSTGSHPEPVPERLQFSTWPEVRTTDVGGWRVVFFSSIHKKAMDMTKWQLKKQKRDSNMRYKWCGTLRFSWATWAKSGGVMSSTTVGLYYSHWALLLHSFTLYGETVGGWL